MPPRIFKRRFLMKVPKMQHFSTIGFSVFFSTYVTYNNN